MVMLILGNYKNNYDIATKTTQWALTPKQLNLVFFSCQFDPINLFKIEVQSYSPSSIPVCVQALLQLARQAELIKP